MDNFKENMRSNSIFSSYAQIIYICSSADSVLFKCAKNKSMVQTFELKLYLQYQNWKNYMMTVPTTTQPLFTATAYSFTLNEYSLGCEQQPG